MPIPFSGIRSLSPKGINSWSFYSVSLSERLPFCPWSGPPQRHSFIAHCYFSSDFHHTVQGCSRARWLLFSLLLEWCLTLSEHHEKDRSTSVLFTADVSPWKFCHLIVCFWLRQLARFILSSGLWAFCRARRVDTHTAKGVLTFSPACSRFPRWSYECPQENQGRQLCPVCEGRKAIWKHRLLSQLSLTNFGVGVKDLKLKLLR